ncbi:hypothetical protein ACEWY4_009056 [Coilia grayii]|uniref:Ig-like domain-containing protein n=1 Tax=Coilia grayii TaxID=363190 RepID=A0ABD1K5E6_9TELE
MLCNNILSSVLILVPPKITSLSKDVVVNEGSNVSLVCAASGKPDPTVSWKVITPAVSCDKDTHVLSSCIVLYCITHRGSPHLLPPSVLYASGTVARQEKVYSAESPGKSGEDIRWHMVASSSFAQGPGEGQLRNYVSPPPPSSLLSL